jgi:hypothetical protein
VHTRFVDLDPRDRAGRTVVDVLIDLQGFIVRYRGRRRRRDARFRSAPGRCANRERQTDHRGDRAMPQHPFGRPPGSVVAARAREAAHARMLTEA